MLNLIFTAGVTEHKRIRISMVTETDTLRKKKKKLYGSHILMLQPLRVISSQSSPLKVCRSALAGIEPRLIFWV